jgi:tRNA/rRNA methyltransferase
VAVCAYELFLAHQAEPRVRAASIASTAERDALYAHLQTALLDVDFLNPGNVLARMGQLRRLLERARPSSREVRLLRGVARQIDRVGSNSAAPAAEDPRGQAARRSRRRKDSAS